MHVGSFFAREKEKTKKVNQAYAGPSGRIYLWLHVLTQSKRLFVHTSADVLVTHALCMKIIKLLPEYQAESSTNTLQLYTRSEDV